MKRQHPEDQLQKAIAGLLLIYEGQRRLRWFAVPNGGWRSKIEAAIMMALGVRAGVPDLVILLSTGRVLFMELKAEGNTPTESQQFWIDWLNEHGFPTLIAYTVEQAHDWLKWQMLASKPLADEAAE